MYPPRSQIRRVRDEPLILSEGSRLSSKEGEQEGESGEKGCVVAYVGILCVLFFISFILFLDNLQKVCGVQFLSGAVRRSATLVTGAFGSPLPGAHL